MHIEHRFSDPNWFDHLQAIINIFLRTCATTSLCTHIQTHMHTHIYLLDFEKNNTIPFLQNVKNEPKK